MNTIPPTDSTVYVRWYGKTVQGKAKGQAFPNGTPLMQRMLLVEIPVQSVNVLTAFLPAHIYDSAQQASDNPPQTPSHSPHPSFVHSPGCEPVSSIPASPPSLYCESGSAIPLSTLRQRYRDFLAAHWDHQRNHLKVEYLQESMRLLHELEREELKAKGLTYSQAMSRPGTSRQTTILSEPHAEVEHKPIVTEERYQQLKEKMKVKLTKKQLRSSGRIEFTDSIQTSFFD